MLSNSRYRKTRPARTTHSYSLAHYQGQRDIFADSGFLSIGGTVAHKTVALSLRFVDHAKNVTVHVFLTSPPDADKMSVAQRFAAIIKNKAVTPLTARNIPLGNGCKPHSQSAARHYIRGLSGCEA